MKKQLISVLGLAVLATPAFASKARLVALGEDIYGSQYINDNRNIFLNAAALNDHKNLITFEWGSTASLIDANTNDPATPLPEAARAEGGFTMASGNLVYGVHLGSESNISNGFRAAAGVGAVAETNNVDVFVAGDAGLKWGANLTYGKSDDGADNKSNILRSRLGVNGGNWDAFANVSLGNKAETAAAEFNGKVGYQLGGSYDLGNSLKVIANYANFSGENKANEEIKMNRYEIGVGSASKLNDKASLFYKVTYFNQKTENDFTGAAKPEETITKVPVVIGIETDATSWLALRGSIAQNIIGTTDNGDDKATIENSTAVNAGASLKFGDLTVDGMIGEGAGAIGNTTQAGVLSTDTLMSYVSMTYKF